MEGKIAKSSDFTRVSVRTQSLQKSQPGSKQTQMSLDQPSESEHMTTLL